MLCFFKNMKIKVSPNKQTMQLFYLRINLWIWYFVNDLLNKRKPYVIFKKKKKKKKKKNISKSIMPYTDTWILRQGI